MFEVVFGWQRRRRQWTVSNHFDSLRLCTRSTGASSETSIENNNICRQSIQEKRYAFSYCAFKVRDMIGYRSNMLFRGRSCDMRYVRRVADLILALQLHCKDLDIYSTTKQKLLLQNYGALAEVPVGWSLFAASIQFPESTVTPSTRAISSLQANGQNQHVHIMALKILKSPARNSGSVLQRSMKLFILALAARELLRPSTGLDGRTKRIARATEKVPCRPRCAVLQE